MPSHIYACMGQSKNGSKCLCSFNALHLILTRGLTATTSPSFYMFQQIYICLLRKGSELRHMQLMEANSDSTNNIKEKQIQEDEEDAEVLKRRISTHPLYGLLLQNHLDCLKVSDIGDMEISFGRKYPKQLQSKPGSSNHKSELDHFMEAYCSVLSKLRAAMEEPQQETLAFINSMHSQLRELTSTHRAPTHPSGKKK